MNKYITELIGTFFLVLTIGCTVLAGAFAVGDISGGAVNPAVAVGISILNLSAWSSIWVFLVANFAGVAVAGIAFKALNPQDP
jgi:aquaporin Z